MTNGYTTCQTDGKGGRWSRVKLIWFILDLARCLFLSRKIVYDVIIVNISCPFGFKQMCNSTVDNTKKKYTNKKKNVS